MEHIGCNSCGDDDPSSILSAPDRNGGDEQFSLVRCSTCGLVYVDPRPDKSELRGYYPSWYHSQTADDPEVSKATKARGATVLRCAKTGNILDIGCGANLAVVATEADTWSGG